ncbi:cupin domain-containing protein [Pseudomonas solani]|uniref:cupin domain-containing protein n=1 Tax=Pseudomonas solani TaxID=2731552 RepID=UPI003C2AD58E
MKILNLIRTGVAGLALLASLGAWAHGEGQETIEVLQEHPLQNAPGMKGTLITVGYAPGQQSIAHRHGGSVIAYVLDGEVVSQLQGEPAHTYKAGESWYEPAGTVHLASRNASATKPATLLVWLLTEEKQPLLEPLAE